MPPFPMSYIAGTSSASAPDAPVEVNRPIEVDRFGCSFVPSLPIPEASTERETPQKLLARVRTIVWHS